MIKQAYQKYVNWKKDKSAKKTKTINKIHFIRNANTADVDKDDDATLVHGDTILLESDLICFIIFLLCEIGSSKKSSVFT